MRILVDALSARQRGGQTYITNLLAHVPNDGSVEVLLLAPASFDVAERPHVRRLPAGRALENPFIRAAWEKLMLPRLAREHRADVLFYPGGLVAAAPRGCKIVTMFRNMIPFDARQRGRYPVFSYDRFRNWLLHRLMLKSMLRADLVIFISDYAQEVIARHARGRAVAGVVIPHGIPAQFRARADNAPPFRRPVEGDYALYVSYIDVYKAQAEVVQAFAMFKSASGSAMKLVLVGPENPPYARRVRDEIARLGLGDEVVLTGALPYAELPALYRNARVNIFASESENCPNTLLEAMAARRPVLCSDRPPMPEFAADGALYFDPARPADLAQKLQALLQSEAQMENLAARAEARSRRYDWAETARRTWDAVGALLAGEAGRASGRAGPLRAV